MIDFNTFKTDVEKIASQLNIADYEIYYNESEDNSIDVYEGEIEKLSSNLSAGASFRCIINGKSAQSYTERFSKEDARILVEKAKDAALHIESEDEESIYEGSSNYAALPECPENASVKQLKDKALALEQETFQADGHISAISTCNVSQSKGRTCIANSKGLFLERENQLVILQSEPVMEKNGEKCGEYAFDIKASLYETSCKNCAKQAAERCRQGIGGEKIPSGIYPVVMKGSQAATLLSVFSNIFSSEAAQKGFSLLKGKEETVIAADCVTLVDDPFMVQSPVKISFDDEGVSTYKKNVIEKGILKTLLYNLKTAAKQGCNTTGNAIRSSYKGKISIAPSNFYIVPNSKLRRKDLMRDISNGIYLTDLKGLHAGCDSISGDFSLECRATKIIDGKLANNVKSVTVSGNFYQLLKDIEAIDDQLEFCLCAGPMYAAPNLKIKGLSFASE